MSDIEGVNPSLVGSKYDLQSSQYIEFADRSYSWNYLERPAFDRYISDLYDANIKVLDLACGTGRVIKHLISRGVRPQNIVGIDISRELLKKAHADIPSASLFLGSIDEFELKPESFDLVTSNMVIHYLDNDALERMLDRVYRVLKPGGTYFFVESDPDHCEENLIQKNANKWLLQPTPWGTMMPYFNRDPRELLTHYLDLGGFDYVDGWVLRLAEEGKFDLEKYKRYASKPSRMAGRFKKTDSRTRELRNDTTWQIPLLNECIRIEE